MVRRIANQSPERVSTWMPRCFPAREISWQGKPPERMSGRSGDSSRKVRTSVYRLTFGQCFSKTFRQYGSHSTCHSVLNPARSKPRSKPPMPANNEPCVKSIYLGQKGTLSSSSCSTWGASGETQVYFVSIFNPARVILTELPTGRRSKNRATLAAADWKYFVCPSTVSL